MKPDDDAAASFVVRIWMERTTNGEPAWRGHIRHVQGESECYFRDLGEMRGFVERLSGVRMACQPTRRKRSQRHGDAISAEGGSDA